jgi:hypothetical protein
MTASGAKGYRFNSGILDVNRANRVPCEPLRTAQPNSSHKAGGPPGFRGSTTSDRTRKTHSNWWLPASRLPGKSLQVGSVCWLLAGWNRSAEFEAALDDRAEFGLSRFSASRGSDTLERARLISAVRRSGLPPIVTILDATMSTG